MWVPRPGLFGPGPQRSWEVRVRNAEVTLWKRVKAPNSQMPTRHMNEFYAKPSRSPNWGVGDLHEAHADVPLFFSYSCV